jgi:hypothetical protein
MTPEPEGENTTTPASEAELDAAAEELYGGTSYPEGTPDWRTVPDPDPEPAG